MPHWHRNSIFGPGPCVPLDRDLKARFLFLCRQHRAPGRLSAAYQDVAEALVRLLGADGRLDPSHATLAALAGCCPSTVRRGLDRLRGLGLLSWCRRLRRDAGTGWRCEQTSNAYWLTPSSSAVPCDVQMARAVRDIRVKKDGIEQVTVAPEVRHAARAVLAAIAQRRMAALGLA